MNKFKGCSHLILAPRIRIHSNLELMQNIPGLPIGPQYQLGMTRAIARVKARLWQWLRLGQG